ncbi:CACTA en-spm transposon protein [Cucumis melo var. makuwa]|uniref:CACTA en-spm transposon protein n=1 Tax=Cucumis melo var. makuwa TaxID=1194695 RepID=A0A5A7UUP6_CUCMM|nr:CACTA en-spm transposon protein [Cucumis melo var. makuwa]TYK07289.1 CACTA en-spm transposon protein [Cucumis melo var. makuwa]
MNRADRGKQPYNHSSGGKSFLQQHHELATQQGHPTDCVELFKETHARGGQFVLQVAADGHSQPLSAEETCKTDLGRRPSYSKGLGWGSRPKSRHSASSSSPTFVERELAHARELTSSKLILRQ